VFASKWITKDVSIWNIVDSANTVKNIKIEVQKGKTYYDIWNGKELTQKEENGKSFVEVNILNFSCLLETNLQNEKLFGLLKIQQKENSAIISTPEHDTYLKELSLKLPVKYHYNLNTGSDFQTSAIKIKGGKFTFKCKHIWREGGCYPDFNARNNHDLVLTFEDNAQRITHEHTEQLSDFFIMSKVVSNGEFEQFLRRSKYKPRYPENFLRHWNGQDCPSEIKNKPVVYVSLEDARSFAEWAGMQLPTEWQWQLAAEQSGDKFIYNEVFEWNESERDDGYNRFVNLRGGCSGWLLPSSWWYLPSAPYAQIAGGSQKLNSHVKYFLLYQGIDRASTIGFRCIKK
jgi:iron(II)-dependent oxidoreductase